MLNRTWVKSNDFLLQARGRIGGAVIAFVGPEATGKSTLVSECGRWLGDAFAAKIKTVHAGKPPSSWLTTPIHLVLPLARRLFPRLRLSRLEGHVSGNPSQPKIEGLYSLVYAMRAVTLAWDRRKLLVKAKSLAANGQIIICDRYPSEVLGTMDSPRLQYKPAGKGWISIICNWLARFENRIYKQIPPPDVVLKLKVSIETAKKRNHERIKADKEADAYVESRHRQSREWHKFGTKYIYDIDTEQSLEETIYRVKKAISESL